MEVPTCLPLNQFISELDFFDMGETVVDQVNISDSILAVKKNYEDPDQIFRFNSNQLKLMSTFHITDERYILTFYYGFIISDVIFID